MRHLVAIALLAPFQFMLATHDHLAVNFSGADANCVIVADDLSYEANNMTVAFWVYIPAADVANAAAVIIDKADGSTGSNNGFYIHADGRTAGSATKQLRVSASRSGGFCFAYSANNALTTDAWQCIVVQFDITGQPLHIFINGSEVSYSNTLSGSGNFLHSTVDLDIAEKDASWASFSGRIYQYLHYTDNWTAQEITDFYNSKGRTYPHDNLKINLLNPSVAEGTNINGLTFRDQSGNGNDGTGITGGLTVARPSL